MKGGHSHTPSHTHNIECLFKWLPLLNMQSALFVQCFFFAVCFCNNNFIHLFTLHAIEKQFIAQSYCHAYASIPNALRMRASQPFLTQPILKGGNKWEWRNAITHTHTQYEKNYKQKTEN